MKHTLSHLIILSLFCISNLTTAQEHKAHEDKGISSLKEIFTEGEIEGHIRNFFMSTLNDSSLKDYYTNAIGGAMMFKSKEVFGFQAGVKGIFTYRAFSSYLNEPDETTGQIAKWEHELYDITDINNFNDLDRLEELYLKYSFKGGYATYGKLAIEETPLLNESDGRMKPFAFKGLWLNYSIKQHVFNASWLDRVSPRSTVEWYDFNEAIGLISNGFQPNGDSAHYHDKTESKGIASFQYETSFNNVEIRANNYYLHNVSNTSLFEFDFHQDEWVFGLQYAYQFPDAFQEELMYEERYMQPDENGQVLSSQIRYEHEDRWNFSLAYTKAFNSGRFLFPKELGRDHFFTSIPRSRLEGLGDADIFTAVGEYSFSPKQFSMKLEFTKVFGPEIGDFEFNKYNIDEYFQLNTGLHYELDGFFEGLSFDLLYVYKENVNNNLPEVVFNTSNYHQINFVTNYYF